ncbi:VOC family protein [Nocardia sp. 2]|uniref:VOC family protein n=1 Tax=Nocardia acididurans TaxID=2802282 RepID=A0ABS1M6F2_9NOCA|nr:VOC family protein [Nocardia acididurans]MBL1076156.1 VOC family protein [Nocardia acididurans]
MPAVNPCLIFEGNAEEAVTFYQSVLGGELELVRYGDFGSGADLSEDDKNRVAYSGVTVPGGDVIMCMDCPPDQSVNFADAGYSVSVEAESAAEAERYFTELSAGGQVFMPFGKSEWAEAFGMCTDKFSVSWMIGFTGSGAMGQ